MSSDHVYHEDEDTHPLHTGGIFNTEHNDANMHVRFSGSIGSAGAESHAPDDDLSSESDGGHGSTHPPSADDLPRAPAGPTEPINDEMTHPLHPGSAAAANSLTDDRTGDFDLNSVSMTSLSPAAQPPQRQSTDAQSEGVPTELLAFNQRYAEDVASQRSAGPGGASLQAPYSPTSAANRRGGLPIISSGVSTGGFNPFQPSGGKAARRNERRMKRQHLLEDLRTRLQHALQDKKNRYALRTIEYEEKLEKYQKQPFPAPGTIALCSCGMATTILNYPNTGFFKMSTNVPAMQIFFAGVAQTIAGIFEWINGVTFAHMAFLTYAAFHMSISMMILIPNAEIFADNKNSFYYVDRIANPNGFADTTTYFLGTYQILFAIHSFALWSCTPTMNLVLCILLFNVFLTYLLQGTANMMGHKPLLHASGWSGIVSGGIMAYLGLSETLNSVWDRTILPTFPFIELRESYRKRKERKERERQEAQEARAQS